MRRLYRHRGFVLLEWSLAAALGLMLAVAVVGALVGFRQQAAWIAETTRLQSDAALALGFLRHYLERAGSPTVFAGNGAARVRCSQPQRTGKGPHAGRQGVMPHDFAPGWHCDLQAHRGFLAIDYPNDRDATWRDAAGRAVDCQGRAAQGDKDVLPTSLHASLSIGVSQGDTTPGLFCRGTPVSAPGERVQMGTAMIDGVERIVIWRSAFFDEVCLVMRGRVRHAASLSAAGRRPSDVTREPNPARDLVPVFGAGRAPDRCTHPLAEMDAGRRRADYRGADGYLRHVVRAAWPIATPMYVGDADSVRMP